MVIQYKTRHGCHYMYTAQVATLHPSIGIACVGHCCWTMNVHVHVHAGVVGSHVWMYNGGRPFVPLVGQLIVTTVSQTTRLGGAG